MPLLYSLIMREVLPVLCGISWGWNISEFRRPFSQTQNYQYKAIIHFNIYQSPLTFCSSMHFHIRFNLTFKYSFPLTNSGVRGADPSCSQKFTYNLESALCNPSSTSADSTNHRSNHVVL